MKAQQDQPQMSEGERIRQRKTHVVNVLTNKFNEDIWRDRLLKICGQDESRIMKALNSFITYVMNDDGGKEDRKAYIADCSLSSISTAFLEAFQMGIEVGGGRDHAYLVNYAGQCDLDISYKGFVYALNKHFDNAFVIAACVFEGDNFTCEISDSVATYKHIPANPFEQSWDKMTGCYCYFTYTLRDGGGKVSRLIMIPKGKDAKTPDSIEMIKSKAKGSWAWKDFPFEQSKKATIRRAAKIPFASIDFGDEDINPETIDNRHYQLEDGNRSNHLRLMMEKHKEMLQDEKPSEEKDQGATVPGSDEPHQRSGNPDMGRSDPEKHKPAGADVSQGQTVVAPQASSDSIGKDEAARRFEEISDADFSDSDDEIVINHEPAVTVIPPSNEESRAGVWDGKTLIIGGKIQQNDFPTARSAGVYLKKVISQRKQKQSRYSIITENHLLMVALQTGGWGDMVDELNKVASEGE